MLTSGICQFCNQEFSYDHRHGAGQKYCSTDHQHKAAHQRRLQRLASASERSCSKCKSIKPPEQFSGFHPYCNPCRAAYEQARRAAGIVQDPEYTWILNLRRYGLTPATFAELVTAQGGRCAICKRTEPDGQGRWHVDHDHACCPRKHSCGKCLRGLLCSRCNIGIGNLRDDPVIIRAAADYLDAHATRRAVTA